MASIDAAKPDPARPVESGARQSARGASMIAVPPSPMMAQRGFEIRGKSFDMRDGGSPRVPWPPAFAPQGMPYGSVTGSIPQMMPGGYPGLPPPLEPVFDMPPVGMPPPPLPAFEGGMMQPGPFMQPPFMQPPLRSASPPRLQTSPARGIFTPAPPLRQPQTPLVGMGMGVPNSPPVGQR